jgi:hypothetical protein
MILIFSYLYNITILIQKKRQTNQVYLSGNNINNFFEIN